MTDMEKVETDNIAVVQVCAKVKEIEDAGLRMKFCGKNAMDMAKEIARL